LPEEIGELENLVRLDIHNNNITKLPTSFGKLDNLKDFLFDKDKIEFPPAEILSQGISGIRNFLKAIQQGGKIERIYEAKLILVGHGEVGKTTLAKKLMYNQFDENSPMSIGIDINTWKFPVFIEQKNINFQANVWDFGGQEIQYALHEFFITPNSLYILVYNARGHQIDFDDLAFWLDKIKIIGQNSPVIVVINKVDINDPIIDEMVFKETFDNIKGFYKVSCKTGKNIGELKDAISNQIVQLEHIGKPFAQSWLEIRKKLELDKREFILYEDYVKWCESLKVNEEEQKTLSRYLHNLGIILHFQDDAELKSIIVLKPEWATKAAYEVLTAKHNDESIVAKNRGRLRHDDLFTIWKNYPADKHHFLIRLMTRFEMCFKLLNTDKSEYIIPSLLPVQSSLSNEQQSIIRSFSKEKNIIRFEYEYERFMPKSIIPRFMCRNHEYIKDELFWQGGMLLDFNNTQALIKQNEAKKKIEIAIHGWQSKNILFSIRKDFAHIHKQLNLTVQENISCLCNNCKNNHAPFMFDYNRLVDMKNHNETYIFCEKSKTRVDIDLIISEVVIKEEPFDIKLITDTIKSLQTSLEEFKSFTKEDIGKKLLQIYTFLDSSLIIKKGVKQDYATKLSKEINNMEKLEPVSQDMLIYSYYLYDTIQASPIQDYSPCILQYCRAIENELSQKIFIKFRSFIDNHTDKANILNKGFKTPNKSFNLLRNFCQGNVNITLGNIRHWMELIVNNNEDTERLKKERLLIEMNKFIKSSIHYDKLIEALFWDKIYPLEDSSVNNNDNDNISYFRNKSAHVHTFNQMEADRCRKIMLEVLNEWTQMIKSPTS